MSGGKKHLFSLRSPKFRERLEAAINGAHRASQIALQKADIAISRTATARGKAEQADIAAKHARTESDIARLVAKQFAPEFQQPGTGFLKRKFPSSQESSDFGHYHTGEDFSQRTFHFGNPETVGSSRDPFPQKAEFDDVHLSLPPEPSIPPAQSALLDIFRNNPDRRPSAAGFLRRPSAANFRRPSVVVEHKLVPSSFEQRSEPIPNNPTGDRYHYPLTAQQVVDEHFRHYYETNPNQSPTPKRAAKKPGIDLSELSRIYGIPLTPPKMEDEEGTPFLPQRRSTLPTVLDQVDQDGMSGLGDGMVRTGSLYSATRKMEASSKNSSIASARKNSLPDISNIGSSEPRVLTRETIAVLSSQRREAIRRQQEEAERLRANPLLYLVSPEVWDWLASQQLVILVVVINIALGILFFKVIL
ncbi:junctophilin-2-like [Stegodyphus dumicola]|uniref:junctophilin-2-like n=1 Tax=Stegodyphus dumicola TaxID=202533 RepID=UPI0015B0968D|nr:junctophilin-2-like [Stegodyphus dumicola]